MLAYLDSNVVIYFMEDTPILGVKAKRRMATLRDANARLLISDLTRLECHVLPLRHGDSVLMGRYQAFFGGADIEILPLTPQVCDRAAQIRADHRFKTPDSLHLAAAVEAGCDLFLSHDLRLSKFPDLAVEAL